MNRLKWMSLFWGLLVALIVLGCGGGGGGGSSTGTTSTTSTSSTGSTTTGTDSYVIKLMAQIGNGIVIDPLGIQLGDNVKFELVNYDVTKGTSSVVSSGSYSSTDTAGAAGKLQFSGQYTPKAANGNVYQVSTTYQGTVYSANYEVNPTEPRVAGHLIDTNGNAVPFAVAQFYNSAGTQVGQATADVTGSFVASVPTTAVRFDFASSSLSPASYFGVFIYGAGTYDILSPSCAAPLPTLTTGSIISLPNTPEVYAVLTSGVENTPPPPPSCSP